LTAGSAWNDVGAQLKLTYKDYEVQFKANGQIMKFNGAIIVANRDGGWIYEIILFKKTITHTIHGTLDITFDNNTTRAWSVTKKRIFASKDGTWANITITLAADGSVAEQGTTKAGKPFTTTFPEPIVYRNCSPTGAEAGPFIATVGKLKYDVSPNSMTAEAGFQYQNGDIVKVGNCSANGYKLTYNISGKETIKFQFY
jgi:hypothetical protein